MAHRRPIVLQGYTVADYIRYLLDLNLPVTAVICGTRDVFMRQLVAHDRVTLNTIQQTQNERHDNESEDSGISARWLEPTLRILAESRRVKLVFCPDISHFRASMATYSFRRETRQQPGSFDAPHSILAVLNLIDIHRYTSSFSVQGIHRSLSTLVEAAHLAQENLIISECRIQEAESAADEESEDHNEDNHGDAPMTTATENPWDEEVSMLNASNRSFGAGHRGWAGRTVKLRTIAERWCTFMPPVRDSRQN